MILPAVMDSVSGFKCTTKKYKILKSKISRMEERCDQIMDCIDESDEDNCKMIEFKNNYNKRVPPFTIEKEDHSLIPAKIWASTQLENVLAISEFSHTIDLKIGITLKWYENRVVYHNLKEKEVYGRSFRL